MNNHELFSQLYSQTLEAQKLTVALCRDHERMETKDIVILLGVISAKLHQSRETVDRLVYSDLAQR